MVWRLRATRILNSLDRPRTEAACPGFPPRAMEFMPGAFSVVRPVVPAHAPGCGDGGRVPSTLGASRRPQRPLHDTTRPPHDRPPLAGLLCSVLLMRRALQTARVVESLLAG